MGDSDHARRPLGSLSTGEARAVARAECFIGYGSRVAVKEDWIEISGLPASPVICDSLSPPLRYTERGETTSIRCSPSTSTNMLNMMIMGAAILGTPVFAGTRVPVQSLWDHLEAGDSLDKFLDSFPSVSRQQAKEVLELAGELLVDRAHSP